MTLAKNPHAPRCRVVAAVRTPGWKATLVACGLAATLGWPAFAQAQQAAPGASSAAAGAALPAALFFRHDAVADVSLSPSGKRLALTAVATSGRRALYVLNLGEQPSGEPVAAFLDEDVIGVHWVNDQRLVFAGADFQAGSGDFYRVGTGLYAVDADGTRFKHLIRRARVGRVINGDKGEIDALDFSHAVLQIPQAQPGVRADEVLIGAHDFRDRQVSSITPMWLNTRSGRTRPMLLPGAPAGVVQWLFDGRAEARVAVTRGEGSFRVHWRAPGESAWRSLGELDALRPDWWPHGVGDDGTLYVTRDTPPNGETALVRFDLARNAPGEEVVHVPGFDFQGGLVPGDPGQPPLGVQTEGEFDMRIWFDAGMQRVQDAIDKRLPGRINELDCRRCGQPDMTALVFSRSDRDPGRWYVYEPAGDKLKLVAAAREGIDPRRMARVDFQRIRARDGRDLPVWITRPAGLPKGQAAPAVVMVHGGPWVRGGHWRWEPMAQYLASRGYLVIEPEFRGSAGYGSEHFKAGWRQWGLAMQDDVADALVWARAQGLAGENACIAGASYGGYAALMGLARHPELYRCGIAWVGVTDLPLYVKGESWVVDDIGGWSRKYTMGELVGDADRDAAALQANSPLGQAGRIKAPLLLAYGGKDRRVPQAHGERLKDKLEAAGNRPEWVVYPDEGHGWLAETARLDFAQRVEVFLQRHLGAQAH